jgi:hypothetical protein
MYKKFVHSDNKEEVIKRKQYSEVQKYMEKKYRITAKRKRKNRKVQSVT